MADCIAVGCQSHAWPAAWASADGQLQNTLEFE